MLTHLTPYLLLFIICVRSFSFDDSSNVVSLEMIEDGKNQYQLLQERGRLPKYGDCWTSAVEHINEGCRYLNEDMQSDLTLRITNCFLEMSGHETYNCDRDKKPNLRGICINSMSDRAFNVYTEFYTHAQNICWFLRGQIWQEKITERTKQVGEQLKTSVNQQETLLRQQEVSLGMQEQLLNYGKSLELVLNESKVQAQNILEDIRSSTLRHQQLLTVITSSLSGLQYWLIGEISWFDSIIFYVSGAIIILIITSTTCTASARLPLIFILSMNTVLERIICENMNFDQSPIQALHEQLYKYIWWCRYFTTTICVLVSLLQWYFYRDFQIVNNNLLLKIIQQNEIIKSDIEKLKTPVKLDDQINLIRESPYLRRSVETEIIKPIINNIYKPSHSDTFSELSKNDNSNTSSTANTPSNFSFNNSRYLHARSSVSIHREMFDALKRKGNKWEDDNSDNNISSSSMHKYNLRSRNDNSFIN